MRHLFTKLFLVVLAGGGIFSCSTDVDLNGDWQDITIVYGLLDQDDNVHFVRINKAFLGDGNALLFAQVRDSSEYSNSNMIAYIQEKVSGTVVRTFPLRDTTIGNRDPGVFYGPDQTVYYFLANDLDENATYELNIEIGQDQSDLKVVTASTNLVKSFIFSQPTKNGTPGFPSSQITYATANSSTSNFYPTSSIKWQTAKDGERYETKLTLNYLEVTPTDSVMRSIDWNLGVQKAVDLDGGDEMEKAVAGDLFYQWVASKISNTPELNGNDVIRRKFRGIDYTVTVAGEELNIYMELNEPVTGIVQSRPSYTNVINGTGLFSSRYKQTVDFKWLDRSSLKELTNGQYTTSFNFCNDSLGLWPNNDQDDSWCY